MRWTHSFVAHAAWGPCQYSRALRCSRSGSTTCLAHTRQDLCHRRAEFRGWARKRERRRGGFEVAAKATESQRIQHSTPSRSRAIEGSVLNAIYRPACARLWFAAIPQMRATSCFSVKKQPGGHVFPVFTRNCLKGLSHRAGNSGRSATDTTERSASESSARPRVAPSNNEVLKRIAKTASGGPPGHLSGATAPNGATRRHNGAQTSAAAPRDGSE